MLDTHTHTHTVPTHQSNLRKRWAQQIFGAAAGTGLMMGDVWRWCGFVSAAAACEHAAVRDTWGQNHFWLFNVTFFWVWEMQQGSRAESQRVHQSVFLLILSKTLVHCKTPDNEHLCPLIMPAPVKISNGQISSNMSDFKEVNLLGA